MKEALTYYIDITTPPSQDILADLVGMTEDAREKRLLSTLAQDAATYDRWRVRKAVTFPELLTTFSHIRVDPILLLKKFPTLQPRLYAIASSAAEDKIRIVTAIVKQRGGDRPYGSNVLPIPVSTLIQFYPTHSAANGGTQILKACLRVIVPLLDVIPMMVAAFPGQVMEGIRKDRQLCAK